MNETLTISPDMLAVLLSPIGLISMVISVLLSSLIPAFMLQLSMVLVFRQSVRFLPILGVLVALGLVVTLIILTFTFVVLQPAAAASGEEIALTTTLGSALMGIVWLVIQSAVLSFVVWNDRGDRIAVWKWLLSALIGFVILILIGFLLGYALSTAQALTWPAA